MKGLRQKEKKMIKYYRKQCKKQTKKNPTPQQNQNWVGPTDWAIFDNLVMF